LPSSGKSMLFEALTGPRAHGEAGMAAIPDPRLQQLADVVHARKVTPAAIRVVEVRGTGPALLGNLRQVDALLVVLDGFSATRVPADDLETLKLELLVADRDHVERRLERVAKQAKSGDPQLKRETAVLELIAFFTAGDKETRAWTLRQGQTAFDAAAAIHSDIARGFIRCEVIRWDDLVAAGSHAEAARRGLQRLEGKTYVVADGDVVNV